MSEELDEYGLRQRDEEEEIKELISESNAARNYKEIDQEVTSSLGLKKTISAYSQSIAIITNEDTATKALDHSMAEAITFVTAKLYEIRDKTARGLVSASRKATNITASGTIKAEHLHSTDDAQIDDDLTVSGDINANGAIVGDNVTDISGIRHLYVIGNATLGNHSSDVHKIMGNITSSGNIRVSGSTTTAINLDTSGHITASGNIKSSGTIIAEHIQSSDDILAADDIIVNDGGKFTLDGTGGDTYITNGGSNNTIDLAVNNTVIQRTTTTGVTVTGTLLTDTSVVSPRIYPSNDIEPGFFVGTNTSGITINGGSLTTTSHITSSGNIRVSGSTTTAVNIDTSGHITASGNISASGNLSATGDLNIDGKSHFEGHITASGNISSSGKVYSDNIETFHGSARITNIAANNYSGPNFQGIMRHEWTRKLAETVNDETGTSTIEINRQDLRTGIIIPYAFKITGFTMFYGVNANGTQTIPQGALFALSQSQMDLNDNSNTGDVNTVAPICTGIGQGSKGYNSHLCTGSCDVNMPAGSSIYFRVKPTTTVSNTTMDMSYTIQWKRINE